MCVQLKSIDFRFKVLFKSPLYVFYVHFVKYLIAIILHNNLNISIKFHLYLYFEAIINKSMKACYCIMHLTPLYFVMFCSNHNHKAFHKPRCQGVKPITWSIYLIPCKLFLLHPKNITLKCMELH